MKLTRRLVTCMININDMCSQTFRSVVYRPSNSLLKPALARGAIRHAIGQLVSDLLGIDPMVAITSEVERVISDVYNKL